MSSKDFFGAFAGAVPTSYSDSSQLTSRSSACSSRPHRIDVTNCTSYSQYSSTSASMAIPHRSYIRSYIRDDFEIERLKEENKRLNSILYDRNSSGEKAEDRLTRKLNIWKEDNDNDRE